MAVFDCLKLQWMGSNTTKLWTSKKVVFELLFFLLFMSHAFCDRGDLSPLY